MIVLFVGKGLFGVVDQVPGVCHVATRFFYVSGIPLVPLDSWAVVEPKQVTSVRTLVETVGGMATRSESEMRGVRVPFSFKSLAITYIRAILWPIHGVTTALLLLFGLMYFVFPTKAAVDEGGARGGSWLASACIVAIPVGSGLLLWLSYRLTRATPERAAELRAMLGLGENPHSDTGVVSSTR